MTPKLRYVRISNRARRFSDVVGPLTGFEADLLLHNAPRWDSNCGNYGTVAKSHQPAAGERVLTLDEWAKWEGPTIKQAIAKARKI